MLLGLLILWLVITVAFFGSLALAAGRCQPERDGLDTNPTEADPDGLGAPGLDPNRVSSGASVGDSGR